MMAIRKRRTIQRDGPHPIDVHVGRKVRIRRGLLGLSQQELGRRLGLTFQQVQKYERGTNRISASRLWKIAEVMEMPVSWFFEGVDSRAPRPHEDMAKRESIQMVRHFIACPPTTKKRLIALIKSIADLGADSDKK